MSTVILIKPFRGVNLIPAEWIIKYGLEKVILEETSKVLLIKSALVEDDFQKEISKLNEYKSTIYQKMENEAHESEVRDYYSNSENDLSKIDPEVF